MLIRILLSRYFVYDYVRKRKANYKGKGTCHVFKDRFKELASEHGEFEEIVKRFSHILFEAHTCLPDCI